MFEDFQVPGVHRREKRASSKLLQSAKPEDMETGHTLIKPWEDDLNISIHLT